MGERQRSRYRIYFFGDIMEFSDVDGGRIVGYGLLNKLNLVIRRGVRVWAVSRDSKWTNGS